MIDEPKRYEILTIHDLFSIPALKRAHMLEDLALWMEMIDVQQLLLKDIDGIRVDSTRFFWIDDGKHEPNFVTAVVNARVDKT